MDTLPLIPSRDCVTTLPCHCEIPKGVRQSPRFQVIMGLLQSFYFFAMTLRHSLSREGIFLKYFLSVLCSENTFCDAQQLIKPIYNPS